MNFNAINDSQCRGESIVSLCQKHLQVEEAFLQVSLTTLKHLRSTLLARHSLNVATDLRDLERIQEQKKELSEARVQFVQFCVGAFGQSVESFSLLQILRLLPVPSQEPLLDQHARIHRLAREIETLTVRNAHLLYQYLSFLGCVFTEMAGNNYSEGYGTGRESTEIASGTFLSIHV